jgi:hypothetical protein
MERAQPVKNAPFVKSLPRVMNVCGDSLRAASAGHGQRDEPTAAGRAFLPMSRQARGLGRIFRPRSRDKRTGQMKEFSIWWIEYSVRSQQYRVSSHSRNPVVARQLLKQHLGDVAAGTFIGPQRDRTTFEDLAQMVVDDYKANGKRSLDRIEDAINHLRITFGGMKAIDITADRVTAYTAGRKAEQAANATVNRELSALRRMFRLGERAGKVAGRPYVALLREDNVRTGFFEPEQFAAVQARLPEDLRPAVEFAYLTGWRLKSDADDSSPDEHRATQRCQGVSDSHTSVAAATRSGWGRTLPGRVGRCRGQTLTSRCGPSSAAAGHALCSLRSPRPRPLHRFGLLRRRDPSTGALVPRHNEFLSRRTKDPRGIPDTRARHLLHNGDGSSPLNHTGGSAMKNPTKDRRRIQDVDGATEPVRSLFATVRRRLTEMRSPLKLLRIEREHTGGTSR